jgi:nicotinamidase-related amidase
VSKQALVVVDMQEYFCRPGHALARFIAALGEPGAADWYWHWLDTTVVPNISRLLAESRASDDMVLFTEFGSQAADGSDLPRWARRHNDMAMSALGERIYLPLSDPAARVIGELAPQAGDVVVRKTTSGPLAGTDIAARLRAAGAETVVVTGVVTDVCVTGMARELADADFDVLVVADACGAPMRESHEWALRVAIPTFASIVVTGDALAAGDRAEAAATHAPGR